MEKTMRRFRQQLPDSEARHILREASSGVLSLVGADGMPYGVPLSYVYDEARGAIYFHSAAAGRKIDCIRACGKASFCVIALDDVKPAEFTTYFRSVIAEGDIEIVADKEEIIDSLRKLGDKYSPGIDSTHEIERSLNHIAVMRLDLRSLSGKEAIELTRKRK